MNSSESSELPDNRAERYRQGVSRVLEDMFAPDAFAEYDEVLTYGNKRYRSWADEQRAYYAAVTFSDAAMQTVLEVSLRSLDVIVEDLRFVRYYYYVPERDELLVSDSNPLTLEEALQMNGNLTELNARASRQEAIVGHGVMRATELLKMEFLDDLDSFERLGED